MPTSSMMKNKILGVLGGFGGGAARRAPSPGFSRNVRATLTANRRRPRFACVNILMMIFLLLLMTMDNRSAVLSDSEATLQSCGYGAVTPAAAKQPCHPCEIKSAVSQYTAV